MGTLCTRASPCQWGYTVHNLFCGRQIECSFFPWATEKRGCGAGHKVHNLLWWRRPKRLLFELASRKSRTLRVGQKFVFFWGPRLVSLWKHTSTTHELGFDPYIVGGGTSLAAQKTGATSQTLDTSLPPRRKHVQSIQSCFLYVRRSLQKTSCTSWCYTYLDMVKCLFNSYFCWI